MLPICILLVVRSGDLISQAFFDVLLLMGYPLGYPSGYLPFVVMLKIDPEVVD